MILFQIGYNISNIQFDLKKKIQTLIDSNNKINAMTLPYILKIDFQVCQTNIGAQIIDNSSFEIFEIVLASFQIENKLERA